MSAIAFMIGCIVLDIGVILTNISEQVLIARKWKFLDRIDHLLLSLSISDLICGIATLGVDSWSLVFEQNRQANSSTLSLENHKIVSSVFDSVFVFSVFASVLHVIAIAVERLYAVRFPRKYYIFTTFTFKCCTISAIWIVSIILTPSFSVLTFISLHDVGGLIRGSVLAFIAFSVFLVYLIIAYFLLRQRKSIIQDFSPECSIQQDRLKRLTILCLFIGSSFVICILPLTIGLLDTTLYHHSSNIMITLNSLINPCIYFGKVYFESRNLTRSRSDTTHALLDSKGLSLTNEDVDPGNQNHSSDRCDQELSVNGMNTNVCAK